MAEIVGILGSSVSIFDALQKFRRYARDVINADKERVEFLHRLACVESVHRALQGSTSATPSAKWVQELSPTLDTSPVYRLLKTMKQMAEILHIDTKDEKSLTSKIKNLKWHSEKKELDAFFGQMKDHCINILVVLQWGEVEILREIGEKSEDVATDLARIEKALDKDRLKREAFDDVALKTSMSVQENLESARLTVTRLDSIEARLQAEEELRQKERELVERKDVERWLSPLEFARRQQIILEKAASFQKGSIGKWFFESKEFKLWKDGKIGVLRGYGQPGAGKTILSSVVVEKLTKTSPETPVVCVYLEKAERLVQTVKNIRGSLLKQLIQFREFGLSSAIRAAFSKASRTNTAPSDDVTTQLLKAEIESHPRVFIVVDGLDEASDETRRLVDGALRDLHKSKLSLLIMSRKDDVTDVEIMCCDKCEIECIHFYLCDDCAKSHPVPAGICVGCHEKGHKCIHDESHVLELFYPEDCEISIETPNEDIALFLKMSVEEEFPKGQKKTDFRSPRRGVKELVWQCYHKPEFFNQIVQHIVDESDGRFLLAREYIKHFKNKNTLKDIKAALNIKGQSGADKLFPFYAEDMERIMKQEAEDVALAGQVLATVYFAKRNLSLVELQQALAVTDGDKEYDPDGESHEGRILNVTKGLIVIDRNTSADNEISNDMTVRLDHLTRREYFDATWKTWFPDGQTAIAKTCLTFLGFDDFAKVFSTEDEFRIKEQELPFISYAVQFWGDHVRDAGPEATDVVARASEYLKDPSRIEAYIQAAWTAHTRHKDKWDVRRSIHPLHICAWFDLAHLTVSIGCDANEVDVQEETHGQTPLMYACRRGSVLTVRRLLEAGASVNKQSEKGRTALFETILRLKKVPEQNSDEDIERSEQIVKLLLDEKLTWSQLDVNVQNPKHLRQTALTTAIEWQQTNIAQNIVEHLDLNVNLGNLDGVTALHLAATNGMVEVVEELLQLPTIEVDLTENGESRTALHLAAKYSCRSEVIEILLKRGADPNLQDGRGGSATLRAVEAGNEKAFQLIASSKYPQADLRCVDEDGRGLIHFAAAAGNLPILNILLGEIPELLKSKDNVGMTPLHEACRAGHIEVVQLLLDLKALTDVLDYAGRTPLTVARQYGHRAVEDILKTNQSNANPTYHSVDNAPMWSLATLRQLEEIKARIELQKLPFDDVEPRTQRNALHCLLITNDKETEEESIQFEILKALFDSGAIPIDDADKHGQTPLHFAAMFGNVDATKILLSHEADTEKLDRFGMTALRIACRNQFLEVAVSLIEAGADIDVKHIDINQLLFAALTQQNVVATGRLIAARADRMAQDEQGRTPDMVAEKDARLLAILKSTKSYQFKPPKMAAKEDIHIVLLENTIQDAEDMLKETNQSKLVENGVSLDGTSARKVRFTPFASRNVEFGPEKSSAIASQGRHSPVTREFGEVKKMLENVSVKEIGPLPTTLECPQAA